MLHPHSIFCVWVPPTPLLGLFLSGYGHAAPFPPPLSAHPLPLLSYDTLCTHPCTDPPTPPSFPLSSPHPPLKLIASHSLSSSINSAAHFFFTIVNLCSCLCLHCLGCHCNCLAWSVNIYAASLGISQGVLECS